jgi:hypothetical protein
MKHQVFGYNYDNPAKPIAMSASIEATEYEEVRKSQDGGLILQHHGFTFEALCKHSQLSSEAD